MVLCTIAQNNRNQLASISAHLDRSNTTTKIQTCALFGTLWIPILIAKRKPSGVKRMQTQITNT
jgi:hypothetical protein